MTRVLFLCERLHLAGGVERFCCALANHLAENGWEVALGSVSAPGEAPYYPVDPRVKLLHAPIAQRLGAPWMRRIALALRQWRIGRALASLARTECADVLVLNGVTTACSVLLADRGLAVKAVCCDHNHFGARSRPWRWLRARLYSRVAAVVSLTQEDRARFAALNPRTRVIANASSLWATAPPAVTEPIVLAVGRHVAQKGFDLLLNAWSSVHRVVPNARLVIVGDGPLTAVLQAQANALDVAHSVQWLLPTSNVESLYRGAAIFVLASRYEGMPLALLEAQSLGVPAVAFDCPTGPREIIGDAGGLVVHNGDTTALSAALIDLLRDPALRLRLGAEAIARCRRLFSQDAHLDNWTALLAEVARR
jgi:glycosyltransferase involved in cell wall biosynthesis